MSSKTRKSPNKSKNPLVGIVMGSQSDWETMQNSANILKSFGVSFETAIVSAHRTPNRLFEYGTNAMSRGIKVVIAGAGGAAHLPGMLSSLTTLPVLGVPVQSKSMDGFDSLLSIVQMPAGVPVGTLAIGGAGATNAGLMALSILALSDDKLSVKLQKWRASQTASIAQKPKSARTRKS